tara:strand:- start:451 stop:651 length:201 start_codon:yes stop_codon:yes gene_type:complete
MTFKEDELAIARAQKRLAMLNSIKVSTDDCKGFSGSTLTRKEALELLRRVSPIEQRSLPLKKQSND